MSTSASLSPGEYRGHNLIFVLGCPRSGTTWMQRLLACHPRIKTGQESNLFTVYLGPPLRQWHALQNPKLRGGLGLACYFTEEQFLLRLRTYMMSLLEPMLGQLGKEEIFLEKTPGHALFVREIAGLLPRCRIIHLVRDPRDVVASLLSASRSWGAGWAPKNANRAARLWQKHVTTAREAARSLTPAQYHELRYEELYRDTRATLQECCRFLGLEWAAADMQRAIDENHPDRIRTTGGGTAIPVWGESAKRSGPVVHEPPGFIRNAQPGNWPEELTMIQRYQIWRVARTTMQESGYPWPRFFLR